MKVWLAVGEQGCYSDYNMWIVGLAATQEVGMQLCVKDAQKPAHLRWGWGYDGDGEEPWVFEPWDVRPDDDGREYATSKFAGRGTYDDFIEYTVAAYDVEE